MIPVVPLYVLSNLTTLDAEAVLYCLFFLVVWFTATAVGLMLVL